MFRFGCRAVFSAENALLLGDGCCCPLFGGVLAGGSVAGKEERWGRKERRRKEEASGRDEHADFRRTVVGFAWRGRFQRFTNNRRCPDALRLYRSKRSFDSTPRPQRRHCRGSLFRASRRSSADGPFWRRRLRCNAPAVGAERVALDSPFRNCYHCRLQNANPSPSRGAVFLSGFGGAFVGGAVSDGDGGCRWFCGRLSGGHRLSVSVFAKRSGRPPFALGCNERRHGGASFASPRFGL